MKTEIKICDCSIFSGRNIYSHRPVMKMVVDIGGLGDIPTKDIPGFNEALLELFPGLKTNFCSLGYEGGFMDRLREGTYMAHVLEHVILEMQYMLGFDVRYGKTRTIEEPSLYYLVYEYENEVCGQECGKTAVFILNTLLEGGIVLIDEILDYLRRSSQEAELGPSTEAIVNEAKKRGIPITRIGCESLVRLGYGKHSRLIESTLTDATSCVSADISCNKQLTKSILSEHKIPVPFGKVVYSEITAQMAAKQIGLPVVVKPFDANQGKGVHLNLKSPEEIKIAFKDAAKYSGGIIVEQYVEGFDYRVLVVGGKVAAVAQRIPARVTGDGIHTVRELVEIVNQSPERGERHEKALTRISLNEAELKLLKKSGLYPESIVPEGETVLLRENGNISTGGTAKDKTDIIHPDNAELAVRAAAALGIDIAGIDFVAKDISKSILDVGGAIVEVNTAPGIRMHLYPSEGKARNVASDIVEYLFPDRESMDFPIVSVTGTNGKTTVVRMISHALMMCGRDVGMTSTCGTYVNGKRICRGDNAGPRSAKALLSNKSISAAVLETARGGIIREGLGYDLADVGVITNITEDHLGIDGINNLEDLVHVKSLVAEAIKKDGAAVLSAEDPTTNEIIKRLKSRFILFYRNEKQLKEYERLDCIRVFEELGWIYIRDGSRKISVVETSRIPLTMGGIVSCNVLNALAAVSALYALKVPVEMIRQGLLSFRENQGRFNMFELDGVSVMLDYGHNPAAIAEACEVCSRLASNKVIGVVGLPGDREGALVKAVGKHCTDSFDSIYIKEDEDLRGRKAGETASALFGAIASCGFPRENIRVIDGELQALQEALREAERGDLIAVFYEKYEKLYEYLKDSGAVSISSDAYARALSAAN